MIPGRIKVGAIDYAVVVVSNLPEDDYGYCDPRLQRIALSSDQNKQAAADTLLHEILHAIWHESGLFSLKRPDEETIVRITSTWLCLVFRDNPETLTFIRSQGSTWPHTATERQETKPHA